MVDHSLPCGVLRHDQFESVLRDRRENGDRLGLILRLGVLAGRSDRSGGQGEQDADGMQRAGTCVHTPKGTTDAARR
ncbi:MAG: hypothetical protein ACFHWZ_01465 [Phycisphaerales bacterium]